MLGLDQALASPTAYVAVDASGCPGSGPWPRRISLTPAGLEPSRMRLLLIRGEHKRRLFERAMDGTDPLELPIRLAFTHPAARLRVHWCPSSSARSSKRASATHTEPGCHHRPPPHRPRPRTPPPAQPPLPPLLHGDRTD